MAVDGDSGDATTDSDSTRVCCGPQCLGVGVWRPLRPPGGSAVRTARRPPAPVVRATQPSPVVEPPPPPPVVAAPEPPAPAVEIVPPAAAAPVVPACSLVPERGAPIRTVALNGPIDATHAPYPRNDSERLLFRQVYDTLVRVDCEGRVGRGLASTWRFDPTGPTWVLTLDSEARFSDGRRVTSADVLSAWGEPGRGAALRPWVRRFVRSMVAVNARVIGITLHDPDGEESLRALANPALAIARREPGVPWPLGTTGLRVIDQQPVVGEVITLERHDGEGLAPAAGMNGRVQFLVGGDADPRDRLDQAELPGPQVDLLVTSDPAVLSYAAALPAFRAAPLGWFRTHVLLSPAREPVRGSGQAVIASEAREEMATDAVRSEARGASGPFWWQLPAACSPGVPYRRSRPVSADGYAKRVVFRADDPVASGLAARLVALTGFADPERVTLTRALFPMGASGMVAVGLSETDFERALADGLDSGYVLPLAGRPFGSCQEARVLTSRAAWLVRSAAALDAAVVPLVDTRTRAIIRRGRSGIAVDWDGALLLDGVRRVGS
jgi:hypothetical protein